MPSTGWRRRWQKNSALVHFGLTQSQAASMLGRTLRNVQQWEGAEREIDNAAALLLRAYLNGYRPDDWPTQNMGRQTIDG